MYTMLKQKGFFWMETFATEFSQNFWLFKCFNLITWNFKLFSQMFELNVEIITQNSWMVKKKKKVWKTSFQTFCLEIGVNIILAI